jgi:hypothetical protein
MKHVKDINEDWGDPPDYQDPPDLVRRSHKLESQRLFKTIAFTPYLALLSKKDDPRSLYVVQMEDEDIEERFSEDGDYVWEWPSWYSERYDPGPNKWGERVDGECIADLVTDAWNGTMDPLERYSKYKHEMEIVVYPLTRKDFGEGLDSYVKYPVPGAEELEDEGTPEDYEPIVKVDLPLAEFLAKEFEMRAYEHPNTFSSAPVRPMVKGEKAYLRMLGALIRSFPEIA